MRLTILNSFIYFIHFIFVFYHTSSILMTCWHNIGILEVLRLATGLAEVNITH